MNTFVRVILALVIIAIMIAIALTVKRHCGFEATIIGLIVLILAKSK